MENLTRLVGAMRWEGGGPWAEGVSSAPCTSIDCLPVELKELIVRWARDLDDGPDDGAEERGPWDFSPTLAAVSLVNREFASLARPLFYEYLEIRGNDESDIGYFVDEIAPRYGQHIRGLGCSFGTLGEDWQPTRKEQQNNARLRALLAQAIPRLVGVTTLITNIGEDDAHFDPARDALAATAVGFGSQLTMLDISHVGHDDPTIEPMYLAQLLARLPNLEDLTLQDVAGGWKDDVDALLVSIRRLECLQSLTLEHSECFDSRLPLGSWTAPLQHLRINDCCHLPFSDIELFTRHFLTTLESLDISEWDRKFSLALPFNLPNLTSLTLGSGFPITRFPSFPSSPVATLELSVVRGQFDLMDVLTALDGFKSTLKTLSVLEDDVWDEEMLKDVKGYCEAHGIECKLGDMLYCT